MWVFSGALTPPYGHLHSALSADRRGGGGGARCLHVRGAHSRLPGPAGAAGRACGRATCAHQCCHPGRLPGRGARAQGELTCGSRKPPPQSSSLSLSSSPPPNTWLPLSTPNSLAYASYRLVSVPPSDKLLNICLVLLYVIILMNEYNLITMHSCLHVNIHPSLRITEVWHTA